MAPPYNIVFETLPPRPVRRASLLLGLDYGASDAIAAVLDIDREEFVQVPSLPPGRDWDLLSLSPDGTQLLYADPYGPHRYGLFLHTLATAEHVMFEARADGGPMLATLSPDGGTIATLSLPHDPTHPDNPDASLAAVGLLDVTSGQQRRLWARSGSWSQESVVCWSPDGTRLAVTYLDLQRGFTTVVLDMTGRQIGLFIETQALYSGNGSWLDTDHLLCGWDDQDHNWKMTILDVTTGTREILGPCHGVPLGRIGNRLVNLNRNPPQLQGSHLLTTDLHGGDPQPFIIINQPSGIRPFDTWISPYEPAT
jgi:hypothetical protein